MLTVGLIIDAYGLTHKISWFGNPIFGQVDIFDDEACLKVIQEAKGRDITMQYPWGNICDGWHREYSWEIDPDFDFQKFLDWIEENEAEIRKKISKK